MIDPVALIPAPRSIRTRRIPRCTACALPPPLCLCAALRDLTVTPRTQLALLMHPSERFKSTSTGRLLTRVMPTLHLRLRGTPGLPPPPPLPEARRLVLFPDPTAPVLTADMAASGPVVLLVPDGTWRQARRITQRDPDACLAERVNLPPGLSSRYGLRRNPRPDTLSTFEAAACALGILEGEAIETRLMEAFDLWVERSKHLRDHGERIAAACRSGA
ncbi:tRNA-uridine aminocarboxypropyltransferase [Chondromyces apiculatus]|uniref:tRNA-uridine aminocarboxypropyltransferase n=1 Tax=Chondromyces apiculatus DSM 436 TaxID=1192034 RepID=A0A017T275_9BACT|nr:tRNA-uridine aminocarboxypropyltransferase [Chondromyces apiculatus]EYF03348.1 DTW domain protein [Chondromyces apiculatus DSM 436]